MPVKPKTFNFDWVRGTTSPFQVKISANGTPLPFDDVRLSVYAGTNFAFRLSTLDTPDQALVDDDTKQISFVPTAAQTRSLIKTNVGADGKNSYEVELRNGDSEEVYLLGTIAGIGGLNDDEGDVS